MTRACPNCGSDRTRRGGGVIWAMYLVLIALAVPLVLMFEVNAAIVALAMLVVIALAHLIVKRRVCLDCGEEWGGR